MTANKSKDTHQVLTNLPQNLTVNCMSPQPITPFERIFGKRLRYVLELCDIKEVELAKAYSDQYHIKLNPVSVSYWLNGKRRVSPVYYSGLKTILAPHLKMAATVPKYGLAQEMLDWDGLVYTDEQIKRAKDKPQPMIIGNLPRSSPGAGHFYRKNIRDEIVLKLLNPDPDTGLFQPGVIALTGLPGSGRSDMVQEVLERVAWFFSGGILYADMHQSPKSIWQEWGRRRFSRGQVLGEIEQIIGQCKGRWLLVAEHVRDGKHLQKLLPKEDIWVLATTYGISALQPLGWEQYAYPLAPLTDEEIIAWLKERLGGEWGKEQDKAQARELQHMIEGLPMAAAILSSLIRSRGWQYVFDAIHDPQRAVSIIRYGSKQESPSSSLSKSIDMAFDMLTPDEKRVLRELAMYAPGNSVPEEIFHHQAVDYQDVMYGLVEKGLVNRFENPRWRANVLRMHRLIALHARATLPAEKDALLARMTDFSAFLYSFLPDGYVPDLDIFDRLYAQRKLLSLAHDFWHQLADEARAGRFDPNPNVLFHLNASVRNGAYLTWMNLGARAAVAWLESIRQMTFITQFPLIDIPDLETRQLWADSLYALGNTERVASNGKKVSELVHGLFEQMTLAGKQGDVARLIFLYGEALHPERPEPPILRFLWVNHSLKTWFQTLWAQQRYGDLEALTGHSLPLSLGVPWQAGLRARWWDFKATLAAHGQELAKYKLEALRGHERNFHDVHGQMELPYAQLAEALLEPGSTPEMVRRLHKLAAYFRKHSFVRPERESLSLAEDLQTSQFEILPFRLTEKISGDVALWLETWHDLELPYHKTPPTIW